MAKYKVIMIYPDGTREEEDEIFDTESAAYDHGSYMCACYKEGGETLYLSNSGDYPLSDEEADFEVVEID